jgi:hypothetical protein
LKPEIILTFIKLDSRNTFTTGELTGTSDEYKGIIEAYCKAMGKWILLNFFFI